MQSSPHRLSLHPVVRIDERRHGRARCGRVGLHAAIVRPREAPERTFADVRRRPNDEVSLRHPSRIEAASGAAGAPAAASAAFGTTTSTVVPSPGTLRTENRAPILSARARIPASPRWPSGTRGRVEALAVVADPQPHAAGDPAESSRTWRAPACLTTLWSASCAMR